MIRRLITSFKFSKSKDLYKVFNIPSSSTHQQIKKQYLKLAKQYHPDYNPSTTQKFKEINAAYQILGDQNKRKEYDNSMMHGSSQGRRSTSTYNNSYYYQDPFRYTGVYNTHRSSGYRNTYEDHARREAETYREYFRQQAKSQENFWKEFHDQQQKNRDRQFSQGQFPMNRLWRLFLFGMGFSIFMSLFTLKVDKANSQYVKVIDPVTNKISIIPKAEFQRNRAYYEIASELSKKR